VDELDPVLAERRLDGKVMSAGARLPNGSQIRLGLNRNVSDGEPP
jgi:hypothetical protein